MAPGQPSTDALILELLNEVSVIELDDLAARLPQLTLAQLFHAVDRLSRTGSIRLSRHGFRYQCAAA